MAPSASPRPTPPLAARDLRPIVVVGFIRSGALALSQALARATGHPMATLPGSLRLLSELLDEVYGQFDRLDEAYRTNRAAHLIANTDPEELAATLTEWFDRHWNSTKAGGRWIEPYQIYDSDHRLPGMLARIPEIFPDAHLVLVGRPGIENVLSAQRARPDLQIGHVMRLWGQAMGGGAEAGQRLGERCLFVAQPEMALEPDAVANQLAAFLDLDPDAAGELARQLTGPRNRQSAFPLEADPLPLEDTPWVPNLHKHFRNAAGPGLAAVEFGRPSQSPPSELTLFPNNLDTRAAEASDQSWSSDGFLRYRLRGQQAVDRTYPLLRFGGQNQLAVDWRGTPAAGEGRAAVVLRATAPGQPDLEWRSEMQLSKAHHEQVACPPLQGFRDLFVRVIPLTELKDDTEVEFRIRFRKA